MPETMYSKRLNELKRLILKTPNQGARIAYLHKLLSMGRISRLVLRWAVLRIDELRAEIVPSAANDALLESLVMRLDSARKRHDKRAAARVAAKPPAPPPVEAPPSGETYAQRIGRLLAEDAAEKEKKLAEENKS